MLLLAFAILPIISASTFISQTEILQGSSNSSIRFQQNTTADYFSSRTWLNRIVISNLQTFPANFTNIDFVYNASIGFLTLTDVVITYDNTTTITVSGTQNINITIPFNSSINITAGVDTTAPALSIINPTNTVYTSGSILFNVSATDATGVDMCWYSLNGGITNTTLENITNNYYNATQTLSNSPYTAEFYCNDTLGNLNNTQSVTFTVNVQTNSGNSVYIPPTGDKINLTKVTIDTDTVCSNYYPQRIMFTPQDENGTITLINSATLEIDGQKKIAELVFDGSGKSFSFLLNEDLEEGISNVTIEVIQLGKIETASREIEFKKCGILEQKAREATGKVKSFFKTSMKIVWWIVGIVSFIIILLIIKRVKKKR